MSRYNIGLNAPGLGLRPQDVSSQLVGALNSVFAGTAAAAGAYTRIENAKQQERARIRQDHAQVAQQVFTEAERKRIVQEQAKQQALADNVQDRQYALLMDSRSSNPEWLLQQGLAGVDNARTDAEENAWQQFTLSQKAAVDRQRERQETEAAADEMRTYRRQLKVMGAKVGTGANMDALVRDPGKALENTVDYFLDSYFGAAGDDIDDREKRAAMADVATDQAVQYFYRNVYPKIEQAKQVNQEMMGHEMVANVTDGFIDGSVAADEAIANIDGVISRQFANRTPAEQQEMRTKMVEDTVARLGELRDGMPADMAADKVEALLAALPAGVMTPRDRSRTIEMFYDRQLPAAAEREAARALSKQEALIRGQVDSAGNPRSQADTAKIMLENNDFERVATSQMALLGLDPENEDHAFAIASIRNASDSLRQKAMQMTAKDERETNKRASLHGGTLVQQDVSDAWKAGTMGTGVAQGDAFMMVKNAWAATGSEVPFESLGITPGQPIDWDSVIEAGGEPAVAMLVQTEAQAWGKNPGVSLPAEAGKQLVNMMRNGSPAQRMAAQHFMDALPPGQSNRLLASIPTADRAIARAVMFADDLQITPEGLAEQIQRMDQFRADGDARQIQRFFDSTNEAQFKDLRATTQKAIKAIATPFGGREDMQLALRDDNMTSYFYDRVFETAMAMNGGAAPTPDALEAASNIVFGEFEDAGFSMVTVGTTTSFVPDQNKHTVPDMDLVEMFNTQLDGAVSPETAQAVMHAVGRSWDATSGPRRGREFLEAVARDMAADGDTEFATELEKAPITWAPVSPGTAWWNMYTSMPNGGVPMIPWIEVSSGGVARRVPLAVPDGRDTWPFLASARYIRFEKERYMTDEQRRVAAQVARIERMSTSPPPRSQKEPVRMDGPPRVNVPRE